jgi:tetratricopeptide (TPR) repeat protein
MRPFRIAAFLIVVCAISVPWRAARAEVKAWEGKIDLPTYVLGEEDPYPPFPLINHHRIYPYTMLDDLTDCREMKSYRAIYLENEFLKGIVLPEMGGRLYSLYDKVNKREVFYRNHVVKYGLVALRGAWISGGIEWNFPNGHTVVTVSPVASTVKRNADGSATVVVGDMDRVTGMHWEVALTLRSGEARLRQDVTLFNSTPLTNLYWFWANAAVPATDDMQFIYPMREVCPHIRGVVWSYPIHDGTDWSWYKNTRESASLFGRQVHRNYFGAYYHNSNYGVVHVADFRQVPGKKTWTWGVAGDGLIWTNLLTDSDGAYNEIQAGRYETQLNYEFLPPRQVEQFTEYWYPVRGLGDGWVEATEQLALNVRFLPASQGKKPRVEVAVSPTVAIAASRIRLLLGARTLREFPLAAISPLKATTVSAEVDDLEQAGKELIVEVNAGGRQLARWSAAEPIDGNPDFVPAAGKTAPAPKSRTQMTVEEVFLAGVEQEKDGQEDAAAETYGQVLERDPGYVPALLKRAWRSYRAANFAEAEGFIARALARNSSDPAIHYAAGVVYRAAQRWGLAQDALWAAIRYGGPPAPVYTQLGEIAIHQKQYEAATKLLRQSLSFSPEDALVMADLAVALRLAGKRGEAAKVAGEALEKMPLLPFARAEYARLAPEATPGGGPWRKALGADVQNYLEVAAWYRRLDDGVSLRSVLQGALRDLPAASLSPLIDYYLASDARREGNSAAAQKYAEQAAAGRPDKVFPHRLEDALVLDEATRENPTDAYAHYYLGNFLFARGRYEDASWMWFQALGLGLDDPVLYRNLGVYAWHVKKDLKGAAGFYERAVELAPEQYRLYVDLSDLYAQLGGTEQREKLFARAPQSVLDRDTVRIRRALLLTQQKQYGQALVLLKDHHFKPWEGGQVVRQVFVACNLEEGRANLAAGRTREAEESFRRAAEYPENLGVGKPNEPHDEEALYWLGEALEGAGKDSEARGAWEEAVKGGGHIPAASQSFQAAALLKLGRSEEGEELAASLLDNASKESADATALFAAGLAEALRGRAASAQEYYRRALERDPSLWQARIEIDRGTVR